MIPKGKNTRGKGQRPKNQYNPEDVMLGYIGGMPNRAQRRAMARLRRKEKQ